ncbi:response regulator [Aquimarina sp. TRL1]|nr:response regulator transcription factor [Aquimarina sp. TRL1]QKX07124.1 response regulator [Aquimarina sp. TRL1]
MNILIVEDETRIAKRIERMTKDFFKNTSYSLHRVDELQEALEYIKQYPLDLVLLDLNLNGDNGFDILGTAISESFHTVIISAYKDRAIEAFEYGVLDFIPKPFNQHRLEQAFERVLTKEKASNGHMKFLGIKKRGSIQLIPVEEVVFIKGAGTYTEIFLKNGRKELHDKSLEKLEQLLPETFERIHKSYLVKIAEVKEILVKPGSKYEAELKDGTLLPIGRTRYKEIKAKWV